MFSVLSATDLVNDIFHNFLYQAPMQWFHFNAVFAVRYLNFLLLRKLFRYKVGFLSDKLVLALADTNSKKNSFQSFSNDRTLC